MFADQKMPAWAQDRAKVWNRIEQLEKRKDAQLCHELNIALPHELTTDQQKRVLQDWAKDITRKGYVVDIVIHAAHEWGDQRNDHAHVMIPLRKIDREANDFSKEKDRYSLAELSLQMETWRERWAYHANRHLERAGIDARIDHRTLEAQGIDRTPTVHLGKAAAAMERRGMETDRGDGTRHALLDNIEREKIKAEIAELERMYALEDKQRADVASHLASWNVLSGAAPAESAPVVMESVADRRRREEDERRVEEAREAERPKAGMPHYLREIAGALWSLGQTMSATLGNVVLGSDRQSLRLQYQRPQAPASREQVIPDAIPQAESAPASPSEKPAEFVQRDEAAAPHKAFLKNLSIDSLAAKERASAALQKLEADHAQWLEQKRDEAEAIASPAEDAARNTDSLLEDVKRAQQERMKQIARENKRPDHERELNELEL
jgi:hypothetical protein